MQAVELISGHIFDYMSANLESLHHIWHLSLSIRSIQDLYTHHEAEGKKQRINWPSTVPRKPLQSGWSWPARRGLWRCRRRARCTASAAVTVSGRHRTGNLSVGGDLGVVGGGWPERGEALVLANLWVNHEWRSVQMLFFRRYICLPSGIAGNLLSV